MPMGFDDCTPVNTNGTTEVQLNGGVSLTAPDKAQTLMEIVPYGTYQAAIVTVEPQITQFRAQSDDIAIEPLRFNMPAVQPVPAAASWFGSPALTATPVNIDLNTQRSARINYFADQLLALTNEPAIGATIVYDTDLPSMPEVFWQQPTAVDATSVTIDVRNAGTDITITGGREISYLTGTIALGTTITASLHMWGNFEVASSDFLTSMPYRFSVQPITVGIGEATNLAEPNQGGNGIDIWKMPIGKGIPIAGRTVINNFFTQRDTIGAAGSFIVGVGYIK